MRNVPSSFKIRGIGETMQKSAAKSFVGSSGGNAGNMYIFVFVFVFVFVGMAMAWAARELGASLRLFVPHSTPGKLYQHFTRITTIAQTIFTTPG